MKYCIIGRYNEIGTKGDNRSYFERILASNIKTAFKANNINALIKRHNNRIIAYLEEEFWLKKSQEPIKNVFGISSFSYALEVNNNLEDIKNALHSLISRSNTKNKTFRISARNVGNKRVIDSFEYNRILGSFVEKLTNMKVYLKNYDIEYGIEIMDDKCYIFDNKIQCYGGLPLGSQGTVYCLIENEKSIVATWLMMKRGCTIFPLFLKHNEAISKRLLTSLIKFNNYKELELESFNSIKELAWSVKKNNGILATDETLRSISNIKELDSITTVSYTHLTLPTTPYV